MATGFPGYNGMIPRENGFLSEMLLRAGLCHLGHRQVASDPGERIRLGCIEGALAALARVRALYGFLGGKTNQWSPTLVHDSHYIDPPRSRRRATISTPTSPIARSSTSPTCARSLRHKPFFMYYCLGAGHAPHHVEPEWIERYRGKFDHGWDRWREEVFARQLAMGIVPAGTQLSPRPPWVKAWDACRADARRLYARQMEVYAAFLEQTDHHIGRVIDFLARLGELDNTLVMIASDNGASAEGGEHGSFNELMFPNRVEPTVEQNLARLDEWGSVTRIPTTPGAGRGRATHLCAAGSGTCTRAA